MSNRPVQPFNRHEYLRKMRKKKVEVTEIAEPRAAALLMASGLLITLAGAPENETVYFASHSAADSVAVLRIANSAERTVWQITGGMLSERKQAVKRAYEALAAIAGQMNAIAEQEHEPAQV